MRDKSQLLLEQAYSLVRESRAAAAESQAAGEDAKQLAIEKTLIKSITEDLVATAAHLNNIKPLLGVFEQGTDTPELQALTDAFESVSAALQGLQSRLGESSQNTAPTDEFPEEAPLEAPTEDMPPSEF